MQSPHEGDSHRCPPCAALRNLWCPTRTQWLCSATAWGTRLFVVRLPGQLCVKTAAEHACSVHISHRGQNSWSHPWLCPRHMQQNNGGCACRQSAGGRGNMHGLCPNCVVRHLLPRFSCSHRGGSSWSLPWLPPPTCSNITQSNILSGCTSQQSGEPRGRRRRPGLSQRVPSEPRRDLD